MNSSVLYGCRDLQRVVGVSSLRKTMQPERGADHEEAITPWANDTSGKAVTFG